MRVKAMEVRKEWLDCAVQGGEFLKRYGHDGNYNWYFSLDRSGRPLVEPYNIFSYTFATMAFGQLSLATGNQEYADIAKKYDLQIAACAETDDLEKYGIVRNKCIDNELINKLCNKNLVYQKDTSQRKECGCTISRDIDFVFASLFH